MQLPVVQRKIDEVRELMVRMNELEAKYNKQFKEVYDAINFLLQKDKQKADQN